ncbi:phosphomannomutase/phosphoglucomutase [Gammaproteobacteria bacterium]|nr:phosphomannomutase/phosphoglucomutase [Gammaproteobacteria bacterium]
MEITKSIFREYDIRGEYPNQINEEVVRVIGNAIAWKCINLNIKEVCVGRDGRNSGKSLLEALIFGLSESGIDVINVDIATSPLLYYAAKKNKYKSGIMITGSHNPKNHNGIKLVIDDKPVSGSEILDLLNKDLKFSESVSSIKSLSVKDSYIEEVSQSLKINKKLKIVIDCGNGAAGFIAPDLYKNLGCEVIELYSEVDGNFPNHHPDPGKVENLKDLIQAVKTHNADLGLAFDGDGDRVGMVDNNGEIVFPDKILMMLSKDVLKSQKGSIIFDVKCSNVLSQTIKENGGTPIMFPTGHFHIKNGIKKHNPLLAGEMSGHIFFNDKWYGFDDGHYSGARIIEMISKTKKSISEICSELPMLFSTPELNINVTDENKFKIIKEFVDNCRLEGEKNTIDGLRLDFEDGWGLIRASNTTPKLVLRFEGRSEEILKRIQNDFLNELARICPDIDINLS